MPAGLRLPSAPRRRRERSGGLLGSERAGADGQLGGGLGFQFDPSYADNGHVWAYWSEEIDGREEPQARGKRKSTRQSIIARYTVVERDGRRVVDVDSELRILEVFQPYGNHNGGTILFGPDGMLYIALGDGGYKDDVHGNSESLQMLLGKVLRIDVRESDEVARYAVPADNPFVDVEGARPEIWCYGLRNVWRMSFDRSTGELWAADVGQNRVEEVDLLVRGGFYGWNTYEAGEEFDARRSKLPTPPDAIAPVASYSHREGLSITGGYVYRGSGDPRAARLGTPHSDFITKRAWACNKDGDVVKLEGRRSRRRATRRRRTAKTPDDLLHPEEGQGLPPRAWRRVGVNGASARLGEAPLDRAVTTQARLGVAGAIPAEPVEAALLHRIAASTPVHEQGLRGTRS